MNHIVGLFTNQIVVLLAWVWVYGSTVIVDALADGFIWYLDSALFFLLAITTHGITTAVTMTTTDTIITGSSHGIMVMNDSGVVVVVVLDCWHSNLTSIMYEAFLPH